MRPDFPPPWGSEPPEDDPPEPGAGLPPALQEVLAVRRAPKLARLAETPAGLVGFFRNTPLAISATTIRRLLHEGRSARYLLPEAVLRYIATHSLYQGDSRTP
jgi:nicotinate-nucleotide adenylyltransferase